MKDAVFDAMLRFAGWYASCLFRPTIPKTVHIRTNSFYIWPIDTNGDIGFSCRPELRQNRSRPCY